MFDFVLELDVSYTDFLIWIKYDGDEDKVLPLLFSPDTLFFSVLSFPSMLTNYIVDTTNQLKSFLWAAKIPFPKDLYLY